MPRSIIWSERTVALVLLAGLGAACSSQPSDISSLSQEIVHGIPSPPGEDQSVVALMRNGSSYCSGTLIAPRVVLTAGHCVTGSLPTVFFGNRLDKPLDKIEAVDRRTYPEFDGQALVNDLAVLLLERPAPVYAASLGDELTLPPQPGETARVVGFGTGSGMLAVKRFGSSIVGVLRERNFTLTPGPAQPCRGDSGGSVFVTRGAGLVLAGVISKETPAA